jgi:DNA primase
MPLLLDLLETLQSRPDINTATLLELFAEHPDSAALQKLATVDMPGDETSWQQEFMDALAQLQKQSRQQRTAILRQRMAESGLSQEETAELRELLKPA